MIENGYVARWHGMEFEASPTLGTNTVDIRLYAQASGEHWESVGDGRYVREVGIGEVERLVHRAKVGTWRGHPFRVLAAEDDRYYLEYAGEHTPVARELGLEFIEPGVFRQWAPATEVVNVRTEDEVLY